jgi:hypothetical protein
MPSTPIPAFALPAVILVLGLVVLRRPANPRVTWDYRPLVGGLAIASGAGGLIIGLVRLLTGT